MSRNLKDIISDVDRLHGAQWGISIPEAHVLVSRIRSLETKAQNLHNQYSNAESEIDRLKSLICHMLSFLEEYRAMDDPECVRFSVVGDLIKEAIEQSV